ncbi:MAG: nucleotidyltransferase family protein [Syntrophomonas sp.]
MDDIQHSLMELATAALNTPDVNVEAIYVSDWELLFKTACEQGMFSRIFKVIENLPDEKKPEVTLWQEWKSLIQQIFYRRLLYTQNVSIIMESFQKAGIPVIILKGLAIARLLHNPEYRMMSDLDILVPKDQLANARRVIEAMGYELGAAEDHSPLHLEYHKRGCLSIELHRTLVHSGFLGTRQLDEWYEHIWTYRQTICSEGLTFEVMALEDELINQVIHFSSHTVYVGTQLKHLYDMALIIKTGDSSLDWSYVERILKITGFYEFGKLLLTSCSVLFHINLPISLTKLKGMTAEQFIDEFLNDYSVEKTRDDWKGWLTITCRFPVILKYPILYPLAWIIEYLAQLKVHKTELSFILRNSPRNIRIFHKKARLLRSFGLIGR